MLDRFSLLGAAPRLEGERVYLRPPGGRDWTAWARLRTESRAFLTPWEPTWPEDALTRAAFRRRLRRQVQEARDDQGYAFLIFRRADDALCGGITLANVRRGVAQTGSLGYWLGREFTGQGYMVESVRAVTGFAFEQLGLHRLEAACLPHNAASRHVLTRAGFREEGYAKEYLCIAGRWQDHVLYGLLRSDRA